MAVGRTIAAPLLFINLLMYLLVVGFASWCLNRFINGQTNHPSKLSLSLSLFDTHTQTQHTHYFGVLSPFDILVTKNVQVLGAMGRQCSSCCSPYWLVLLE
jgi:hypothetical protein